MAAPSPSTAPFFAINYPRISEEDDLNEFIRLSEEERLQIHCDLYGVPNGYEPTWEVTDEMIAEGTRLMQDAIDGIPAPEKDSYLHATRVCPDVVRNETRPELFLRCTNFQPWDAAVRLIKYWDLKERILGDGAFHPLSCNPGTTSLHPDAIDFIARGFATPLPEDVNGRAVLLVDRSFLTGLERDRMPLMQAMWYGFMTTISESEAAQRNGVVVLAMNLRPDIHVFDRKLSRLSFELLRDCLPFRLRALHVCQPMGQLLGLSVVLPIIRFLVGKWIRRRLVIHQDDGTHNFTQSLGQYGLHFRGIPDCLGGSFNLEEHRFTWFTVNCARDLLRDEEHHNFLLHLEGTDE